MNTLEDFVPTPKNWVEKLMTWNQKFALYTKDCGIWNWIFMFSIPSLFIPIHFGNLFFTFKVFDFIMMWIHSSTLAVNVCISIRRGTPLYNKKWIKENVISDVELFPDPEK
jgi:hypothetical protein